MVMLEFPPFVNETLMMLLLPRLTLPKLRADLLALSNSVAAVTVRVATLLVMFPALFETVTANCVPLSELVVAGVV